MVWQMGERRRAGAPRLSTPPATDPSLPASTVRCPNQSRVARAHLLRAVETGSLPPSEEPEERHMGRDIIETAAAAGTFRTLASALREADLVQTLKGAGPYTVFAPTDAAFDKLPKAEVDSLLQDKEKLKGILLFHVLRGNFSRALVDKMHDGDKMKTISGRSSPWVSGTTW
jgi:uncharacterized surface protein with fasciclin (FAS1) repeats